METASRGWRMDGSSGWKPYDHENNLAAPGGSGNRRCGQEPAGEIVRALAWAAPERVQTVLKEIEGKVPRTDMVKVAPQVSRFLKWLASALSQIMDVG